MWPVINRFIPNSPKFKVTALFCLQVSIDRPQTIIYFELSLPGTVVAYLDQLLQFSCHAGQGNPQHYDV